MAGLNNYLYVYLGSIALVVGCTTLGLAYRLMGAQSTEEVVLCAGLLTIMGGAIYRTAVGLLNN
jgi:hypothetical protein